MSLGLRGKEWMFSMIRTLYDTCERYRTLATWQRDPAEAAEDYRAMLQAPRERCAGEASALTAAHLQVTREPALAGIRTETRRPVP